MQYPQQPLRVRAPVPLEKPPWKGPNHGKKATLRLHEDPSEALEGVVVRDDRTTLLFQLPGGRIVFAHECYSYTVQG